MGRIREPRWPLFLITFSVLTLTTGITKILKILKDTLVVTHPDIGAQLIPFLKTWALIPLSLLFIKGLILLRHRFSYRKTYCIITGFFLAFLSLYVFLLHGHQEAHCFQSVPASNGFFLMLRYWPLSLFYVACELWSIVMISMLFWTYIGEVVTLEEGRRFFSLYSLDIAGMLMGPVAVGSLYMAHGSWEGQLKLLMLLVVGMGFLQMALFSRLCRHTKKEPPLSEKKNGLGFFQMLSMARHPFIGSLGLMVFLFEFTDNLFEVLWKSTLGQYALEPQVFSGYLAKVTSFSGIGATIVALGFSYALLKRYSWSRVAALPPMLLAVMSTIFFVCYFSPSFASWLGRFWGVSALGVTVFVGAVQTCVMSTAKVTLFDNTRDLAFQVCSSSERGPARSFSDALATRFGKSISSLTLQSFTVAGASIGAAAPYIASVIGVSMPLWIGAIVIVGNHFSKRSEATV